MTTYTIDPINNKLVANKVKPTKETLFPKTMKRLDNTVNWVEHNNYIYGNTKATPEEEKKHYKRLGKLVVDPKYKKYVKNDLPPKPKQINHYDKSTYPSNPEQRKSLSAWELIESTMSEKEKQEWYTDKAKTPVLKSLMTKKELSYVKKPEPMNLNFNLHTYDKPKPTPTPKVRELDVREVVNRNAELRAERTRQKLTREFGNRCLGYMRLKMECLE